MLDTSCFCGLQRRYWLYRIGRSIGRQYADRCRRPYAQVEASSVAYADPSYPVYAPDTDNPQFSGKTFLFPGPASTSASGHATSVGARFYGNSAMAYGIDTITSYETNNWIGSLVANTVSAPVNASRIANHSWVGNGNTPSDSGKILRLADREVQRNEYIQVVGMANGLSVNPLLGSAYNVIAVGRTDGGQDRGADAVDSVYTAGRTRPDLVAPQYDDSAATLLVAAASALLVETGHAGGSSLSHGSSTVSGLARFITPSAQEPLRRL